MEEGWGGCWGHVGSQRQVIPYISSAVSSISDRKRLNPQDRPRQLFGAVWHHLHPY